MSASGWRTAIVLAALALGLIASALADAFAAKAALLFGLFLIGCGAAQLVFRRIACAEEKRRDLEDRVRNPPS